MNTLRLSSLLAFSLLIPACAAETTTSEEAAPPVGQAESEMMTCYTSQGVYICKPDLYVSYATETKYAPGNPQNIYPGTYITYIIANKGTAAAGPFTSTVTDYYGKVLKSQAYAGLAVGATTSISIVAPYYDGWTRTAVVDSNNDVNELNESNNTFEIQTGLSPFL